MYNNDSLYFDKSIISCYGHFATMYDCWKAVIVYKEPALNILTTLDQWSVMAKIKASSEIMCFDQASESAENNVFV